MVCAVIGLHGDIEKLSLQPCRNKGTDKVCRCCLWKLAEACCLANEWKVPSCELSSRIKMVTSSMSSSRASNRLCSDCPSGTCTAIQFHRSTEKNQLQAFLDIAQVQEPWETSAFDYECNSHKCQKCHSSDSAYHMAIKGIMSAGPSSVSTRKLQV